jgi:hypothetical protein
MFYKDPGNITPRKFVKVNISAKDDAALARRRYVENNKVDFPHLQEGRDNQVCNGTYMDFYFNTTHTTGRPFILTGNVHVCALSNIFCHRYIKIRHSEIIYFIIKYILFLTVRVKLLQQLDNELREAWPEGGMKCEVTGCHSKLFGTYRN